ncbi:MAG: hypothetical protein U1F41_03150 [Burkholderiales bacterium]
MTVPAAGSSHLPLAFLILGQRVHVECADAALSRVVAANFDAMAASADGGSDLRYRILEDAAAGTFSLACEGAVVEDGLEPDDLLFALEKSLTVELQRRRADLFFLHAAAVERGGVAFLLAAESGSGKSTTAWGLLHHGFRYLSDELSPVDVEALRVHAYPHALCLKHDPPVPHALPPATLRLGRTRHVPVAHLPAAAILEPRALGAVFLVTHRPGGEPALRPVAPAEAGARLYVTALNALAHPNRGLSAAARIAERVPCFELVSAGLDATSALVRETVDDVLRAHQGRRFEG